MSDLEQQIADEMGPDDDGTVSSPEPEPDPTPEPEPEPEPNVPPSDVVMERMYRSIDKRATTYAKAVGLLVDGTDLDLHPCPLCAQLGTPAFVDLHGAGNLPEQVVIATQTFLGFAHEAEYQQDEALRECPKCAGQGKVRTGSKVPRNETAQCAACKGYGYVPPPVAHANGTTGGEVLHFPAGEAPEPHEGSDRDPSGEPRLLPDGRDNPNFGKWPQFKIPVPPWGATAGLTAQDAQHEASA